MAVTVLCRLTLGDSEDATGAQIVILALLLAPLSATVRRLHDLGRSGWWSLLGVFVLHWLCRPGDAGDNRYGPRPHTPRAGP